MFSSSLELEDVLETALGEIQRLLEESGTESSKIMKYLFEDQEGEKKSDTPW